MTSSGGASSASAASSISRGPMLSVPCKRTGGVDLYKPLKQYIKEQFSDRHAQDADDEIQVLQQMRRGVEKPPADVGIGVSAGGVALLEAYRDVLQRYLATLAAVDSRFPFGAAPPPQGGSKALTRVNFTWQDAFKPNKKAWAASLDLEKAAVAFNLGATLSQLGAAADRSTPQGLKVACHAFQGAAGAWAFVRDSLAAKAAAAAGANATVDMGGACCGMLERLMLGQAQECFYEKAAADGKPSATCARIAMQVSLFFTEASAAAMLPPLSTHLDRPWLTALQLRGSLFQALAQYHAGMGARDREETGEEIGETIARLQVARGVLLEARKAASRAGGGGGNVCGVGSLLDAASRLECMVADALKRAEEENERVFLVKVPPVASLPPIQCAVLVAPAQTEKELEAATAAAAEAAAGGSGGGRGLPVFAGIVPDGHAKAMSRYTDAVDSLIRTQHEAMERESELAKVRLDQLGLPRVLRALDGDASVWVSQELRDEVEPAMAAGGLNALQSQVRELGALRQANRDLLAQVEADLDAEAQADAEARARFGAARWARPLSGVLTRGVRDRMATFARNLAQAGASDAKIEKEVEESVETLALLNYHKAEDALPHLSRPMVAVHGDELVLISRMRQLLSELENLGVRRASLEDMLRDMKKKDDIMPRLMSVSLNAATGQSREEEVFRQELGKYDSVVQEVQRNIDSQKLLLQQIEDQSKILGAAFSLPSYQAEVQRVLQQLEVAAEKHKRLSGNVGEGLKFYIALQDALTSLKQQCSDFIMTRGIEKDELSEELERRMRSLNLQPTSPTAAAAAPPLSYGGPVPPTYPQVQTYGGPQAPGGWGAGTPGGPTGMPHVQQVQHQTHAGGGQPGYIGGQPVYYAPPGQQGTGYTTGAGQQQPLYPQCPSFPPGY